jgi:hypothetical protein
VIDYLRLAFGTIVVLLPGVAVTRALGQRSVSAVLAWSLAAAFVAWAVVFTVHSNIKLSVLVLAAITVGALIVGFRTREPGWKSEPGSAFADGEDAGPGVARERRHADLVHDERVVALFELVPDLRRVAFHLAEAVARRRPEEEEVAGALGHRRGA